MEPAVALNHLNPKPEALSPFSPFVKQRVPLKSAFSLLSRGSMTSKWTTASGQLLRMGLGFRV